MENIVLLFDLFICFEIVLEECSEVVDVFDVFK